MLTNYFRNKSKLFHGHVEKQYLIKLSVLYGNIRILFELIIKTREYRDETLNQLT